MITKEEENYRVTRGCFVASEGEDSNIFVENAEVERTEKRAMAARNDWWNQKNRLSLLAFRAEVATFVQRHRIAPSTVVVDSTMLYHIGSGFNIEQQNHNSCLEAVDTSASSIIVDGITIRKGCNLEFSEYKMLSSIEAP